jgi:selenide,water dikinase
MRLGHCICNPKQPCPCELFKQKNICMCAGERLESPAGPVQLTKLVEKAGCASKIDQAFLKRVLKDLPAIDDPRVLVGVPAGDDAGIYDMGSGKALVQTVDVFTPSVDDPYTFGQVAAANSVSDIYAMGGTPMIALSIIGFPARKIPDKVMYEILCGGIDKMKEAGVAIIGGHSIDDADIKAGFAVTGMIDKDKVVTNAGARPHDVLILTKPLGTGIINFAAQIGRAEPGSVEAAAESMTTLNKEAARLMVEFDAHACTDVTGFGLMGHLAEMASASGVDVEVTWDDIPLLAGVLEYAAAGILPGAIERNKESCAERVVATDSLPQEMIDICYDAQTSGGLLIAIAESCAEKFLKALHKACPFTGCLTAERSGGKEVSAATVIGRVLGKGSGIVHIRASGGRQIPSPSLAGTSFDTPQDGPVVPADEGSPLSRGQASPRAGGGTKDKSPRLIDEKSEEVPCCADAVGSAGPERQSGAAEASGTAQHAALAAGQVEAKFKDFLSSAGSPHGLDAYTKQAIAIALSVAMRCEPCLKMHLKNAKNKGFTQDEIDEAAWMGISFGGSPAMVFYEQNKS